MVKDGPVTGIDLKLTVYKSGANTTRLKLGLVEKIMLIVVKFLSRHLNIRNLLKLRR